MRWATFYVGCYERMNVQRSICIACRTVCETMGITATATVIIIIVEIDNKPTALCSVVVIEKLLFQFNRLVL